MNIIQAGTRGGYKTGDLVIIKSTKQYGLVLSEQEQGYISVTYNIKPLSISKYWPIKQIQLWALRKSFKNL